MVDAVAGSPAVAGVVVVDDGSGPEWGRVFDALLSIWGGRKGFTVPVRESEKGT